jgi:hypothetical protein
MNQELSNDLSGSGARADGAEVYHEGGIDFDSPQSGAGLGLSCKFNEFGDAS